MYPAIDEVTRIKMLQLPTGKIDIVIDTDTNNEIDDQFAIAYALFSPERFQVKAILAAPYVIDDGIQDPAEGMELSYQEIHKLLRLMNCSHVPEDFVLRGSQAFMDHSKQPVPSPAADAIIRLASSHSPEHPLYVVAIGAITNVASAIQKAPDIIKNMVVVWLGGNDFGQSPDVFNVNRDKYAGQVIFDCGVPLIHVPTYYVSSHLITSVPALRSFIGGANPLCDYFIENVQGFRAENFATGKEIWDVSAFAVLMDPSWSTSEITATPIITDQLTWSFDYRRPLMRNIRTLDREAIMKDLYHKLRRAQSLAPQV